MVKVSTGCELQGLLELHAKQGKDGAEIREQIASKIVCNLGSLCQQAYREGNLNITLKSNELLGKEFGLFSPKKQLSAEEWGQSILEMPSGQLKRLIEGIIRVLDT